MPPPAAVYWHADSHPTRDAKRMLHFSSCWAIVCLSFSTYVTHSSMRAAVVNSLAPGTSLRKTDNLYRELILSG